MFYILPEVPYTLPKRNCFTRFRRRCCHSTGYRKQSKYCKESTVSSTLSKKDNSVVGCFDLFRLRKINLHPVSFLRPSMYQVSNLNICLIHTRKTDFVCNMLLAKVFRVYPQKCHSSTVLFYTMYSLVILWL